MSRRYLNESQRRTCFLLKAETFETVGDVWVLVSMLMNSYIPREMSLQFLASRAGYKNW